MDENTPFSEIYMTTDIIEDSEKWREWKYFIETRLPYQTEVRLNDYHERFAANFRTSVNVKTGDSFSITEYTGNAMERKASHLDDGYDAFLLYQIYKGEGIMHHGKDTHPIKPGRIYLLDLSKPFNNDMVSHTKLATCRIPRSRIQTTTQTKQGFFELNAEKGPGILLRNYLLMLPSAIKQSSRLNADKLFNPVVDLANACLTDAYIESETSLESIQQSLFQESINFLKLRCHDNQLRISQLADYLTIKTQACYKIFAAFDTSFTQELRRIRVEKACFMIEEDREKMEDIASHCGFSGASQFSRSFKERLGLTPRDYRISVCGK
ncbi:MAG: helix-turn-helix domain-containing protein [Cellvibrionales bacterium]|nr:helix-turn-helix domain-containing protein [Cellvibrionales bacterium]